MVERPFGYTPQMADADDVQNPKLLDDPPSNAEKDPDDWVSGDEPMTGAQASYLQTLAEETGEAVDPDLSKADASKRIDELKARSPRVSG